jgi:hypothetical protein
MWVCCYPFYFGWLPAAACCSCKLSSVYYIGPTLRVCLGMALSSMTTLVQLFLFVCEVRLKWCPTTAICSALLVYSLLSHLQYTHF